MSFRLCLSANGWLLSGRPVRVSHMCRDFGCGDGGGPTGPNRLPTRGPSVGCSPPCLGPTGSVACSACVPGDWHAYEGRVERVGDGQVHALNVSCGIRLEFRRIGGEIPHKLTGKLARFAWSVHLRPASLTVPRCVSQVISTVVRIVLNLTSSVTGLFKFHADIFI